MTLSPAMKVIVEKHMAHYRSGYLDIGSLARERFNGALASYIESSDSHLTTWKLYHACGYAWNVTAELPHRYWHNVRDAIENAIEADQWERRGHTYSGAARRIRPTLANALSL